MFSRLKDYKYSNYTEMDEKVYRLLRGNFVNYAAIQLTIGDTKSSFKHLLPIIVDEKFNFNENEIKKFLSENYPNFEFYIFNPWVYAKDLWRSRFVYDLAFNHEDGKNGHVFHSISDNRVECGMYQISSDAKNQFVFVYYRYNPDNAPEYDQKLYLEKVKQIANGIRSQHEFDVNPPLLSSTSFKIKALNPVRHCWNFVVFANENKDPVIKSIIKCPDLMKAQSRIQYQSSFIFTHWWSYFVDKYNYYCTFAQFDDRPYMEKNISVSKFQVGYDIGNLNDPILMNLKDTLRDLAKVYTDEKLNRLNNISELRFHENNGEVWDSKFKILYEMMYQMSYDTKKIVSMVGSNNQGKNIELAEIQYLRSNQSKNGASIFCLFFCQFILHFCVFQS